MIHTRTVRSRGCWLVLHIICIIGLCACGKKGDPIPPLVVAPERIKEFTARAQGDAVNLRWRIPQKNSDDSPLQDLKGFKIIRSIRPFEDACKECPKRFSLLYDIDYESYMLANPRATTIVYADRDIKPGYLYTYRVVNYNTDNRLSLPSHTQEVFWDTPSLPPRNLRGEFKKKSVVLTWEAPQSLEDGTPPEGVAGYNLYRTLPGTPYPFSPANSELITTCACRDRGIDADKDYLYTLRAVRKVREGFIESESSEEITINTTDHTPPAAPRDLVAIPTFTGVMLKWTENEESDIKGYNLYRKREEDTQFKKVNSTILTRANYLDSEAEDETSYIYAVTAIDDSSRANESERSQEVHLYYHY